MRREERFADGRMKIGDFALFTEGLREVEPESGGIEGIRAALTEMVVNELTMEESARLWYGRLAEPQREGLLDRRGGDGGEERGVWRGMLEARVLEGSLASM